MAKYRYFSDKDFENCLVPCSIDCMNDTLLSMLDGARHLAGIPFIVNCGYRSKEWEKSNGRSGDSAHVYGLAVDIKCLDSISRFKIVSAAIKSGFPRIGIAKRFIHLDIGNFYAPDKFKPCIWLYD